MGARLGSFVAYALQGFGSVIHPRPHDVGSAGQFWEQICRRVGILIGHGLPANNWGPAEALYALGY